ncbi:hypothetical protein [Erythrobacter sp. JK5]|uniref:hypothetical protein n=1 Tax=Erythrobacter sp. JK5 TaxID=2829500 RepID=UPI001BA6D4F1|nr:hypothetical protein [Erythrobacter sp. JK5]QUL37115.1 hypothetical protein KDC96_12055 [Erythrobacter sp. JK5]
MKVGASSTMLFGRSDTGEFTARRRRRRKPIAAHPAFVPVLAVWGAAAAGLIVLVLPRDTIANLPAAAAFAAFGPLAHYLFAAIAAAIGAACAAVFAKRWRGNTPPAAAQARADDDDVQLLRAINPASELGSASLDAPIETEPGNSAATGEVDADEAIAEAWPGSTEEPAFDHDDDTLELCEAYETDAPCESAACEPDPLSPPADEIEENSTDEAPVQLRRPARRRRDRGRDLELVQALTDHRARQMAHSSGQLDLGVFAQVTANEPAVAGPAQPTAAAEKLRETPVEDLSLVQMVERLALALQQHRSAAQANAEPAPSTERDAALADALRALTRLTENSLCTAQVEPVGDPAESTVPTGQDTDERDLREALGKLQNLRGAA